MKRPILETLLSYSADWQAPLEFVFQEQSYSSLYSGRSSTWDHVLGDIDDPCGVIVDFCGVIANFYGVIANFCGIIADFCGVIADPCGVVAIPEAIGGRAVTDRCATR